MSSDAYLTRGIMLVISSPSGAGKTTLTRMLMEKDHRLSLSVSSTTRPPREGEVEGKDYYFLSQDQFAADEEAGKFLESAVVFGNRYGTPRAPVEAALADGRDVVFDVDWQGARALRASAPEDVVSVFVLPPSLSALRQRLQMRAKDSADVIDKRMAKAEAEISHWAEYDYVILNHELAAAFAQLEAVVKAERLRRARQLWLGPFIDGLHAGH
jgi:guanylate kinase